LCPPNTFFDAVGASAQPVIISRMVRMMRDDPRLAGIVSMTTKVVDPHHDDVDPRRLSMTMEAES